MKKLRIILIIVLVIGVTHFYKACRQSKKSNLMTLQSYQVKPRSMHKVIYFTGTIQPLHVSTLTSPMDAVIETIHYHYGQSVKEQDVVMTLSSNELQKQYNDTLTDYLKSKESYTIAHAKFIGTQELWDAGLLSKNNYLSEQSGLNTTRITLMQSKRKLTELLEKTDADSVNDLSNLTLTKFNKVKQALNSKHNLIHLKASGNGVLLYPPQREEEQPSKLTVGSIVKAGQVIALVGDLTGLSVEIEIPEMDINQIHSGIKATITGVALGQEILHGELVAVNAQASSSANGALPSFNAIVEIKNLTPTQQQKVKVGMSASIALAIESRHQLLIPIRAVKQEHNQSIVQIQSPQGNAQPRVVSTGAALADQVVIERGLNAGDVVLYD